ncbi:MAG: type I restriction endonuclease subunit R [Candidatus Aenigmarchaeota archaeon]|nr:type I restriction endonuclease subunit R [Candidatus Aenigmarchaeota archaeon]
MRKPISEDDLEQIALDILKDLGYKIIHGPDISPDGKNQEREYNEVVLTKRLRRAIDKINPKIPNEAKEEAIKKILRPETNKLILNNYNFHKMLTEGVDVEYRKGGRIIDDKVKLFDEKNNEFLAVNQFTIIEDNNNRRPDIILFLNGLPIAVIELKNAIDENATIQSAFNQFQTYMHQIPSLFRFNEILVISDGLKARAGTITATKERFMAWKTINNKPNKAMMQLEVLLRGMFNKETLLDLINHFIVFEKDKKIAKILAAYHQYNAVNNAVESTIKATKGNKKAGVVWHTQGSGKSLSMVFYAGKLVLKLDNPTLLLLTDRNDLDDQLFGVFSRGKDLLRQTPTQANSRKKLKELLKVASGGIVFTTIQKFFPEETREKYPLLSERKNIVVIADEAHRTQYGFGAKVLQKEDKATLTYGFAKYLRDALPNASFIGFTGTPIEKADKSTPAVFGKYIDIYDIQQAVEDGTTVRIYYESRLSKLELKPEERPKIDKKFEVVTEGEEIENKEKLKSKWSNMEKIVGSGKRIKRIAKDIVNHFEKRLETFEGKGMIVCMSRRICIDIHREIIKLRPEWYNKDDDKGIIKVIMTGSAPDPLEWQEHIRNKPRRKAIGTRMKDPDDPLKLVIVRDMWLTGFDAPSLHTMYIDKPMKDHNLMQAIARVNRVFKDKPGGLIVDYLGVAYELRNALATYTESGGKGKPVFEQEEAVALMLEKYEIVTAMFHSFNYKKFFKLKPKEKISFIPITIEHILKQKDGKKRYLGYVAELSRAFALAAPHEKAMKIKEDVGFFQAVKSTIAKTISSKGEKIEGMDSAIKQILSEVLVSDRVIDIFEAAGLKKPDISILSDEFLEEVRELPQKNLAFEMLKKLLNDEIRIRSKKNLIQAKSFREMLEKVIKRYINKSIETAQVIEELIKLAKDMKEADKRGEELNLTDDEMAFYDALGTNDSSVKLLGDETLRIIAKELVKVIRNNRTVDWTVRESVQANLRRLVKRILRKYGYPPDKQKTATDTVLKQANALAEDWAESN